MKHLLTAFCTVFLACPAGALNSADAIIEHSSRFTDQLEAAWTIPALSPLRYTTSLTEAAITGETGNVRRKLSFDASTYLTDSTRTITGHAGYNTVRIKKGILYDNEDIALTSPYLTFSDGPGWMNRETYGFGGSYAARKDRVTLGIGADYQAVLSYRTVDPRPRNVTGRLNVCPSLAVDIGSTYTIGTAISYCKYKQTSSISFISEYGSNPIYHLTGLGTAYQRFTGSINESHYSASSWALPIALVPVDRGFYASVSPSFSTVTQSLVELNRLPLSRTHTPAIGASAGWKTSKMILGVDGYAERRRGTENIFGDPVSGQYPVIASLTMYSALTRRIRVGGSFRNGTFSANLYAGVYSHNQQYRLPYRKLSVTVLPVTGGATYTAGLRHGWLLTVSADAKLLCPVSSKTYDIITTDENLKPVVGDILQQAERYSKWQWGLDAKARIIRHFGKGYFLGLTAGCSRDFAHEAAALISVNLLFN